LRHLDFASGMEQQKLCHSPGIIRFRLTLQRQLDRFQG
jgi:hypothetical protein